MEINEIQNAQWLNFWASIFAEARRLDLLDAEKLQQNDESADAACEEPK